MDSLASLIGTVKRNLSTSINAYPNEASVSVQIVLPTLTRLGWDTTNPNEVVPEYSVSNRKVDYALIVPKVSKSPKCIIEVKAIGKVDADQQLFEYAFHTGVPLAFLTDGREWRVYLPIEPGSYQERLVRTFDFTSGDENQIAKDLHELLSFENVASGKSIEIAKKIKEQKELRKLAKSKIGEAWNNMTTGKEAIFVDFLIEETSLVCGFAPERQDVIEFLNDLTQPPKPSPQPPHIKKSDKLRRTRETKLTTYWLFNEEFKQKNYTSAYMHIMESLAPLLTHESLKNLKCFYQRKTDITLSHRKKARPVLNGKWWIHVNSDSKTKYRQVADTCKESSVKFQSKEGVLLPDPTKS